MKKNDIHIYLSEAQDRYIKRLKQENGLPSVNSTIAKIIDDHRQQSQTVNQSEIISEIVAKRLAEELKSLKFGINSADKNSQIALLLLNQLLLYNDAKFYSLRISSQLTEATKIVEDKIQSMRTKKLNRNRFTDDSTAW